MTEARRGDRPISRRWRRPAESRAPARARPRIGDTERYLLSLAILLCFCGALGVDEWTPKVFFLEVMAASTVGGLLLLALVARLPAVDWFRLVLAPGLLLGAMAVVAALVFVINIGPREGIVPSLLAQRFYLFYFLGPLVYVAWRLGLPLADIERLFVASLYVAVLAFVAAYLLLPIEGYATSGDPALRQLVLVDDWRGVRVRGPMFAMAFLFVYHIHGLARSPGLLSTSFAVLGLLALALLFLLNVPRAVIASILLAALVYALLLSSRQRMRIGLLLAPLAIVLGVLSLSLVWDGLGRLYDTDLSFSIRVRTVSVALEAIAKSPWFGFGQASNYSVSYRQLFGPHFYPSDIGFLGVWFRYGLFGVVLYLAWGLWLLFALLALGHGAAGTRGQSLLFALTYTVIVMLTASALIPVFTVRDGIPIGAFAWGYVLIRRARRAERGSR